MEPIVGKQVRLAGGCERLTRFVVDPEDRSLAVLDTVAKLQDSAVLAHQTGKFALAARLRAAAERLIEAQAVDMALGDTCGDPPLTELWLG